ncbi:phosphatidate cytidylyltransferase [Kiloniella sp.]|uniref:phosphatidate cytidylyltransferase n=1 Tax=Kiloniella sp. TaxID=1938587 RepID=UPI003B02B14E
MTDVMDPQPKQPKKKSDLLVRSLSSILLGPLVLAAVYFGSPYSDLLIFLCSGILAWEWASLCGRGTLGPIGLSLIASVIVVMLVGLFDQFSLIMWGLPIVLVSFYGLTRLFFKSVNNSHWYILGLFYISISSLALLWIRNIPEQGLELIFWVLFVVWATDIGAYFSGRSIGGPKIAPKISPNKTWAGLIGGMLSAAVVSYIFTRWMNDVSPWELVISGALLAVISQAGDFFESHVKRRFDAKDSSRLIPGHGGLFDRVDGLLACAIVVAGYNIF